MKKVKFLIMKKTFWILFIALFAAACANEVKEADDSTTEQVEAVVEEADEHAHAHGETMLDLIELNEGERWLVNEEMKPHVQSGENILKTFFEENSTNYDELVVNLENAHQSLIKSCTMEGKSHDELHKWLHPTLEAVKELKEANTSEEQRELTERLVDLYDTYHQYFQ